MLHVSRLTDRRGSYYVADLATELGRPSTGRWLGAGAAGLGLSRQVDRGDLEAVLSGVNARTGRALVAHRGSVSGFDLTFTAPKSVSILMAMGAPDVHECVLEGHRAAVDGAMDYLAGHGVGVRRGTADERSVQPVDGVVAAAFTHGVSRSLDPHLHSHVVVANLGHGPDGRWTAIDGRGIYAHAPAAGRLYDASLRIELGNRLGITWTPRRSGAYEVSGIAPEAIGTFSSRQAQIRSALAGQDRPGQHRARTSRRATRVAWAATRDPKGPIATAETLHLRWGELARGAGLELPVMALSAERAASAPTIDEHHFAADLVTRPHATAARRDAVAAWAGALPGGATATDVGRCVDRLADWGDGVGVAEPERPLAGLVPSPSHLSALGSRPATSDQLAVWLHGAAAVDGFRRRWTSPGPEPVFHRPPTSNELAAMPARRLADFLATRRVVDDVRRRLGRSTGHDLGMTDRSLGRG
ncbi:MAG: MobF family relaxase [Acidimicrobiales bacterium]